MSNATDLTTTKPLITILIVDDSESDRLAYRHYLQSDRDRHYRILEAETLKEGLELWQSETPDGVLVDYRLPDGDGLEFLEILAEGEGDPKLPVIFLTGNGDERTAVKAMKLGAINYLIKEDLTPLILCHNIQKIFEHKLAESKLQKAEYKYRDLVEQLPGIVYTSPLTFSPQYAYISPYIKVLLGVDPDQWIAGFWNNSWITYIYPEDREWVLKKIETAIAKKTIFQAEYRMIHQDGRIIWVKDLASLELAEDQKTQVLKGVAIDITDLKIAEEKLALSLEKEKELSQLGARFITTASHEFRTPLTVILSSASILQKYDDRLTKEKRHKHLEVIQKTVKHMTKLLEEVLIINSTEQAEKIFNPQCYDLLIFCCNLNHEIEVKNSNYKINFIYHLNDIHSNNPRPDQTFIAKFDINLLQQILSNLLSNAIKYSPQNLLINFSLSLEQGNLIFQICDRGIGIPENDLGHLFEPFHRGSNVGDIDGRGLGLSILRHCVDLHQGTITVDSKINEGTSVTVTIPYWTETNQLEKEFS
jgi:PAS domain S-box-containing protein